MCCFEIKKNRGVSRGFIIHAFRDCEGYSAISIINLLLLLIVIYMCIDHNEMPTIEFYLGGGAYTFIFYEIL